MYTVYILYSRKTKRFYKGQTSNLERRLTEHNSGKVPYTSAGGTWSIVWSTSVNSRTEAVKLEKKLKNISGAKKILDFIRRNS